MKKVLITGITGQDGAYLADFLLKRGGYQVFGLKPRRSNLTSNHSRLKWLGIENDICFLDGDLTDLSCLIQIIKSIQPDEVYNLAAQSYVGSSWDQPVLTAQICAIGAINVLESIRLVSPHSRYYQASTSEMYGLTKGDKQNETTPFYPRSPYANAKLHAHWATINYRESFGLFTCSGILFNHESPLRGLEFVTRKVTHAVARIKLGLQDKLTLGNVEAKRDWGHAKDYVRAMWLMLNQNEPDDYVIATGRSVTVRNMCEIAFGYVNLNIDNYLELNDALHRPAEVNFLNGDASKARNKLGWVPQFNLEDIIREMVDADIKRETVTRHT